MKKGLTPKEFFESEWYKDGTKQLCADGWPTFVVPVNIKIRELLEQNQDLAEQIKVNLAGQERELKLMHEVEKLRAENERLTEALKKSRLGYFSISMVLEEGNKLKLNLKNTKILCDENFAEIEKALRGADEK